MRSELFRGDGMDCGIGGRTASDTNMVPIFHGVQALPDGLNRESEAARKLKLALRVSRLEHAYSMTQLLGIYPT